MSAESTSPHGDTTTSTTVTPASPLKLAVSAPSPQQQQQQQQQQPQHHRSPSPVPQSLPVAPSNANGRSPSPKPTADAPNAKPSSPVLPQQQVSRSPSPARQVEQLQKSPTPTAAAAAAAAVVRAPSPVPTTSTTAAPPSPKKAKDSKPPSPAKNDQILTNEPMDFDTKDLASDAKEGGEEKAPKRGRKRKTADLETSTSVESTTDRPRRSRQTTEHWKPEEPKEKAKMEIPQGSGQRLGDIDAITQQLSRHKAIDEPVVQLHRIIYVNRGENIRRKHYISSFTGFTFDKNSKEAESTKARMDKLERTLLVQICHILHLQINGTKNDIIQRIFDFLMKPSSSLCTGHGPQPKRRSSSAKAKSKSKKRSSTSKPAKKPKSDEQVDENESESSEEEQQEDSDVAEEVSSSEDDEPLSKKIKTSGPTDDELVKQINTMVREGNLEELSKKKIRQRLEAHFGVELESKKSFISSTVDQAIADL